MKILISILWLAVWSCGSGAGQTVKTPEPIETQKPEILIGKKQRSALEKPPHNEWFLKAVEAYKPDVDLTKELKPLLKNVKIKAFMGSWCSDSQREIPRFFKILDETGFKSKNVTLVTVDRNKTTPNKLEEGLNIKRVPTLIFYKGESELNRIVEYPMTSLEQDMLTILKGNEYTHAYAE